MEKVAVIGLGNIATRHRRNIKTIFPGANVYAMSSSKRSLTDLVTDCDGYLSDIESIIKEQVDMVIVASPATCHLQHSRQLIKAGIPVLLEKPVTASVSEALELQKIISETRTPVAVGYCLRYLPSAQIIKKLIADEYVGNIYNVNINIGQYLPDWRPSKSYQECVSANKHLGGGVLLELSHEIDYAQWMFGELNLLASVLRTSPELEMDVESIADIMAVNSSGIVTNIHLDFLQKRPWRQCHIIGSKGRLVWDLIRNEILHYTKTEQKLIYSDPEWDKNGMYLDMLSDFKNMTAGASNQCVSVESSVKVIEFIENIKKESIFLGTN